MVCISLGNIWDILIHVLQVNLTWQLILLGLEDHQHINITVSLVCFLIYKKYLVDTKYLVDKENCNKPFF